MIQNRIRKKQLDYTWPGFVDALSSLLMVIIFVLMIFVISQFFISQKMSGQDEALIKLKNNLTELSELTIIRKRYNNRTHCTAIYFRRKIYSHQRRFNKRKSYNKKISRRNTGNKKYY